MVIFPHSGVCFHNSNTPTAIPHFTVIPAQAGIYGYDAAIIHPPLHCGNGSVGLRNKQ